jgi:hypothetical protein
MRFFSCMICMAGSFPVYNMLEQICINAISFLFFYSYVAQITDGPKCANVYTYPWLVCTNKYIDWRVEGTCENSESWLPSDPSDRQHSFPSSMSKPSMRRRRVLVSVTHRSSGTWYQTTRNCHVLSDRCTTKVRIGWGWGFILISGCFLHLTPSSIRHGENLKQEMGPLGWRETRGPLHLQAIKSLQKRGRPKYGA